MLPRQEEMAQGSSFPPLLSDIMFDNLDKELERRRYYFCHYNDD
jgi:hypothetical protein